MSECTGCGQMTMDTTDRCGTCRDGDEIARLEGILLSIADMEGEEGMTDAKFVEQTLVKIKGE